MNLSEFKAWFEGFTEDMDKPPTAKQWKRVKARVEEITSSSSPSPWPVFVERYVRPNPHYDPSYWLPKWTTTICVSGGSSTSTNGGQVSSNTFQMDAATPMAAFGDLGRNDALMIQQGDGGSVI